MEMDSGSPVQTPSHLWLKKSFRQPHLCLQLQAISQAAMILGGGGGQRGNKVGGDRILGSVGTP